MTAAGLVQARRARATGTRVEVWAPGTQVDDPGWLTVCEHGSSCMHATRALAVSFAAEPEAWCETGCRDEYDRRHGAGA